MKALRMMSTCMLACSLTLVMFLLAGCQGQPGPATNQPALADAERLKASGQYDEALAVLRRYLDEQPGSAYRSDALVLAGECEMELRQYENAQKDFQDAQIKPRNSAISARAKFGMGQAAFGWDQYADAIRSYEAALSADKNAIPTAKALQKLGFAYIRSGNWTEGRKRLNAVVRSYPGSVEAEQAAEAIRMPDSFELKCGSFETSLGAERQLKLVKSKGADARIITTTVKGRTWQTVVSGKYASFADAKSASAQMNAQGLTCFVFP